MTTETRRGAGSGAQPPAASVDAGMPSADVPPAPRRSSWGRFASSWAVALRMARRDVRRYRGRSLLIVLMVALPTMLLTAGLTLFQTERITGAEYIPSLMGDGVAMVTNPPAPRAVFHGVAPDVGGGESEVAAKPIPGFDAAASAFDNADAIGALTGTRAIPWLRNAVTIRVDGRRSNLETLALDGRAGLGERLELVDGRWPATASEAMVSTGARARGIGRDGTVRVSAGDKDVTLTIVGTTTMPGAWNGVADLVTMTPVSDGAGESGWILLDDAPMPWSQVRELNTYGLQVFSAEAMRNPPPESELPAELRGIQDYEATQLRNIVGIGGVILLVMTTLLVGPAFAVSAARQRRTLALSASNGATTAQLRRTVLAQAVVLGVTSALAGAALGVGLVWVGQRFGADLNPWIGAFFGGGGPFDVPWLPVAFITAAAMVSTVIAALLPARRLGRLDIVGVMKGQNVSPRPSPVVFGVGLITGVGGGVLLLDSARKGAQGAAGMEVRAALGAIALVVGAIMLTPVLLVAVSRLGARLPVALRMATRDAGRQRSRSVPAISAVLAAVAVLTMVLISTSSDTEQNRREYLATNLEGEATLSGMNLAGEVARIRTALLGVQPDLVVTPAAALFRNDPMMEGTGGIPTKPYDANHVNVVPPGCRPLEAVTGGGGFVTNEESPLDPCLRIGTDGTGNSAAIRVLPAAEIARRLDAIGLRDQAAAARDGKAVIGRVAGQPSVLTAGTATMMTGTERIDPVARQSGGFDPAQASITNVRTFEVPAVEVPMTKQTAGALVGSVMLLPTQLAAEHDIATITDRLLLRTPDGAMSPDLVSRLRFVIADDLWIELERGFDNPLGAIIAALLGVFLLILLVTTLTSTALTLAEQEKDQATLAALGSGRGTRRVMAGAQALVLTLVGAVLGVAVGILPGLALTYPLTAQSFDPVTGMGRVGDPVVVIPWLTIVGFVLAAATISAGLAAAGIRKAPDATRRTA